MPMWRQRPILCHPDLSRSSRSNDLRSGGTRCSPVNRCAGWIKIDSKSTSRKRERTATIPRHSNDVASSAWTRCSIKAQPLAVTSEHDVGVGGARLAKTAKGGAASSVLSAGIEIQSWASPQVSDPTGTYGFAVACPERAQRAEGTTWDA